MSDTAYLALLLDGPLQSWGFSSRFQRRTTGLHPTKSGVVGMICAAMGLAKGSDEERQTLPQLRALKMTSITIPRLESNAWTGETTELAVRRLEDFHTVGGGYDPKAQPQFIPRKASGGPCDNATVSHRQYLTDARFGVILAGDRVVLDSTATALRDPIWGVWLGRKNCIPAEPLSPHIFDTRPEAEHALIRFAPIDQFTRLEEVVTFDAGTDSYNDQAVSFGRSDSSAEGRDYAVRRVNLVVGKIPDA